MIVKIAGELKDMGNKAVKSGDLRLALAKYQKGLRYIHEIPELDEKDPPELGKTLHALKFSLHSNSALMQLKLAQNDDALSSATKALEVSGISDADKGKAYYRRGLAKKARKDEEEAIKDLELALKHVPGDAGIQKELNDVRKKMKERRDKEKKIYSKAFDF